MQFPATDAAPRRGLVGHLGLASLEPIVLGWIALTFAHLALVGPLLQNGDAAVYADQIAHRVVSVRTTHIGYMLLGVVFDAALPFSVEQNLDLMCLAFASAGAVAQGLAARRLGASRAAACVAAIFTFAVPAYLRGAVLAEVDVVACALVLVSLSAWLGGRRPAAALAFGAAMLTTPVSALSLPLLVLTRAGAARGARPRWADAKNLALFGAVSLATYLPLVLWFWQDYWFGGRGLLHAPRERWDVGQHVARSTTFLLAQAPAWLAMGLGGALAAALSGASVGLGVLASLAVTAALGERFLDVPVQLPNVCVLATLAVVLVDRLPRRQLVLPVLAVTWALAAWPAYGAVAREVDDKRERRATYLAMASQTPRLLVVGLPSTWEDGLPFEWMVYRKTKLDLGLELRAFRAAAATIATTRQDYAIWLLSPVPPGTMDPFVRGWRREPRTVRGKTYEVWLPNAAP